MAISYLKCIETNCDIWFPEHEHASHCAFHRNDKSFPTTAPCEVPPITGEKNEYIKRINEARVICHQMDNDTLEAHITSLLRVIEEQKQILFSARAVLSERVQKMTDEERIERSKKRVVRAINEATNKPTMKSDPIGFLVEKYGITRDAAKALLAAE